MLFTLKGKKEDIVESKKKEKKASLASETVTVGSMLLTLNLVSVQEKFIGFLQIQHD